MVVVRFADGGVLGFKYRSDAERFLAALQDRLRQFGLELHAEKTRLIKLRPHAIANRKKRGEGKPDTFDSLGFPHICERHRKTGVCTIRRKTSSKRTVAKLNALHQQFRQRRHEPIAKTGQSPRSVVQGYFNYHAVLGNMRNLGTFRL
jgi:hypothetical protein